MLSLARRVARDSEGLERLLDNDGPQYPVRLTGYHQTYNGQPELHCVY